MKTRLFATLLALPFTGVGIGMLWSIANTLSDARDMEDWVRTEARLTAGGYETHAGEDSDSYEAYANYQYRYGGQDYSGDRVGLSSGGDNIGEYQRDMGRRLLAAHRDGATIEIFVDPDNPSAAIIDRDVRWGLVGFKSIFVIVFGGAGIAMLVWAWRFAPKQDSAQTAFAGDPWLANDDWRANSIRSGSRNSMWFAWGFAIFWNAISSITPFIAYYEIVKNDNYIILVALLFPLIGIGLLVWAVRRTLEWRRFGPAPLVLDPFPGSIGGQVGGTIDLGLPFDRAARFRVTLTNIHSYVSGSGKNRSQREDARWQDAMLAHAEPAGGGTRLTFCFDVPEGLHESDAVRDDDYYLWRLNLAAEIPGADLDRDYDIPVFATREQSRSMSDLAMDRARFEQAALDEQTARGLINLEQGPTGKRMVFPMGRNAGPSLIGLLIGSVFAILGWYLAFREGHWLFGLVFGGLGLLVAVASFYAISNSLVVTRTSAGIRAVRRLLGLPISETKLRHGDIVALDKVSTMRSRSGSKHTVYYNVCAVDRAGNNHVIADGFKGIGQADAAIRLIAREFDLPLPTALVLPGDDEDPLGPQSA